MQIKEGGAVEVEEVIAVTMGPDTAVRALHKAVSLGADRSVHLSDDALAGSDVAATGYALAQALKREEPDLVLLGQQSDDGECYTIGAVVADHLQMPSLTQVIKIDIEEGKLRCERQAEYGYDTVDVQLPAVISVGDAINEPRYPSLKAIMGAKKKPMDTLGASDADIDTGKVGAEGSRVECGNFHDPPAKEAGADHRGRGHGGDGREDRRLARRKEAAGMRSDPRDIWSTSFITRTPSTRTRSAPSPRARRLAYEIGGECHAVVVGDAVRRHVRRAGRLWRHQGVPRRRARGPGPAGGRRDGQGDDRQRARLRAVRRRPAGLRDRRRPGRPPERRCDDGGHGGQGGRTASWWPSARSCRTRRSPTPATAATWA